ncbi:Ribosomal protein S18 acetylase RimI [Kytococcus aerolatus]|uniref:Ribosomal protein S18 acetylase RimI n=1 Tax=Kytococcus aerolatus TaxID=592308 RepID=A0A212T1X6_9MICO|nr:GNAT family N-acetyltransferase [Kytococcus aerolatus]SNC60052.1 Ribosomal protein S18 acetylase RimI [Kytococcus aerolatus]
MLESLPPAARTDLEVDRLGGTVVTDAGDHLVVRTPDNPGYHWGNFVQVTSGDSDDVERWLALFAEHFPTARHRAFGLARPSSCPEVWGSHGLAADDVEALTATRSPSPTPVPQGYTVRTLQEEDEWEQRLAAELAENAASGEHPANEYAEFMRQDHLVRRRLQAAGTARWIGAFTGDGALAASLGMVDLDGRARYQSVLTAPEHRRRGLARHLLAVAADWAVERGAAEIVIVAEADSDAGRLYRRAGFAPGPLSHGWYAPSWPVT